MPPVRCPGLQADRDMAEGKLETLGMAVTRFEAEALQARNQLEEAQSAIAELDDLPDLRAMAEDVKMTVEAARMTMMARRSAADELRREGEARKGRKQQVTKDLSGWRYRLETATTRTNELAARREETEQALWEAAELPESLTEQRNELSEGNQCGGTS